MSRPVLTRLPLSWLFNIALLTISLVFLPSRPHAQPKAERPASAAPESSEFRVTIRPRPQIGAPPDLQEMVIRSADGNVMFFVEWLLRPLARPGAPGYDQGFFDIGKPIKEIPGARYTISGRGDFSKTLSRRYLGLSFDEIAKLVGYEPTALEARFDAGRGIYQSAAATAAEPYDPLYSSFGKFNFENIPCNPLIGVICGAFKAYREQ